MTCMWMILGVVFLWFCKLVYDSYRKGKFTGVSSLIFEQTFLQQSDLIVGKHLHSDPFITIIRKWLDVKCIFPNTSSCLSGGQLSRS